MKSNHAYTENLGNNESSCSNLNLRNDNFSDSGTNMNNISDNHSLPNYKDQVQGLISTGSRRNSAKQNIENIGINGNNRSPMLPNFKDQVSPMDQQIPLHETETVHHGVKVTRHRSDISDLRHYDGVIGAVHISSPFRNTDENNFDDGTIGYEHSGQSPTPLVLNNQNETSIRNHLSVIPDAYVVEGNRNKAVAQAHPVNINPILGWINKNPYLAGGIMFLIVVSLTVTIVTVLLTSRNINETSSDTNILSPTTTPSSLQPSITPTAQQSDTCFKSREELRLAIEEYLSANNNKVRSIYGDKIDLWCVSQVDDFSYLFNLLDNVNWSSFNEDISRWNTSSATTMEGMFQGARMFNQDLSRWDVSSVTSMERMFQNANAFNQNLSKWKISSLQIVSNMFNGAFSFNGDVSSWDTSFVIRMDHLFNSAMVFNGDLSTWNVSSVTTLESMFQDATRFNSNISSWDVSNVVDTTSMFRYADRFNQDISRWDVSSVTSMYEMFTGTLSFNQNLSRWNVSGVINFADMFANAVVFNESLCSWGPLIQTVANTTSMFKSANSCPNTDKPDLTSYPLGPFCHTCG